MLGGAVINHKTTISGVNKAKTKWRPSLRPVAYDEETVQKRRFYRSLVALDKLVAYKGVFS